MKNEIFTTRKTLNYTRVLLVIAVCVLLALFCVVRIVYMHNELHKNEIAINNEIVENKNKEENKKEEKNEEPKQEVAKRNYAPLTQDEILKLKNIYDDTTEKQVFLTFDDGPNKSKTEPILDILKKNNVKANFFVLGQRTEYNSDLIQREYNEGHFIGNHSYTHQYGRIYASVENVWDEYNSTNNKIKEILQNPEFNTLIFRFPGGRFGGPDESVKNEAAAQLEDQGIGNIDWNALTRDAESSDTKEQVLQSLKETAEGKTTVVLLMHDASDKQQTVDALQDVIDYFKNEGYTFKTFYDYLGR